MADAGGMPDDPGWSPAAVPATRRHLPRPPSGVFGVLGVVAACYLTALLVLNLSTSSYASSFIARIFPQFGGGTLDQGSIAAEWQAIEKNYFIRDVPSSPGTQAAEQGIVQSLHDTYNDRFSAYLTTAEYRQLTSTLGGVRDGSIGIALEARCAGGSICAANQTPTDAVIEEVLSGQPADRAGLKRGDVLLAVNGVTLSSLGTDVSSQIRRSAPLVRGTVGTSVTMTVRRGGATLSLTARRANLQIPSVFSTMIGHVLYLQVTGFDTDTGDAARTQLRAGLAAGATSIILDLRENGGGYVTAAQSLVSEFVQPNAAEKDVVVRRGRLNASAAPSSAQEVIDDPILAGGLALTEPMVVLVNGDSASASEITTAALHDYHRAAVVGEKTFGKGSVQVDFPLPDGADLHLTVERWYGPNGENIDGTGITPDHVIQLSSPDLRFRLDAQSAPAATDPQLQEALAVLGG